MDILGFKNAVNASSTDSKLFDKIKETISHIFDEKVQVDASNNRFKDYSYQLSVFSNSLIYSTPISNDDTTFYALGWPNICKESC